MRTLLVVAASSLALAALLVMFTPFLSDFSVWHISGEQLTFGAFLLGLCCCAAILPARRAAIALLAVLALGSLLNSLVIASPALEGLVPNPVTYINLAEQQWLLGCVSGGLFFAAGGALGIGVRLVRGHGSA